ncbi:hypothetical protein BT96DRAFT_1009014 [Gymnopus androsaceus JB14]|uniref:Uncharacterized protein n=1 Tax=Gymnopus androsaceus JB14 TaxID=1447944 RepID=A0A6A4GDH9_9AGAR|nr:hypothetical protein BT96DRAFT_1009014 [Gymnopus androsaceus JB14]
MLGCSLGPPPWRRYSGYSTKQQKLRLHHPVDSDVQWVHGERNCPLRMRTVPGHSSQVVKYCTSFFPRKSRGEQLAQLYSLRGKHLPVVSGAGPEATSSTLSSNHRLGLLLFAKHPLSPVILAVLNDSLFTSSDALRVTLIYEH